MTSRLRGLGWPALALVAVIAVAAIFVARQPVDSPWWNYSDADAIYTGSGLNILIGQHTRYLDHPGLPVEELIALTAGTELIVDKAKGDSVTATSLVDSKLLNMNRTRPIFRGWAIAFFMLGAILSFLLATRLFRHWAYGLTAGLLWCTAPEIVQMSIQIRPDVLLGLLLVVSAYLIGWGVEKRSAAHYSAAALLIGLATIVKMHAAGLLPALVLAVLWRPPAPGWLERLRRDIALVLRRYRYAAATVTGIWIAAAVLLNLQRGDLTLTRSQKEVLALPVAVAAYGVAALVAGRLRRGVLRAILNPLWALLAAAFVAGIAIPATFDVPDGLQSWIAVARGLSGNGINSNITGFAGDYGRLGHFPLLQCLIVLALAAIAAAIALRGRDDPRPVIWFVGVAVLTAMAFARFGERRYFTPPFLVAVPAILWLGSRVGRRTAVLGACALVAWALVPQFQHMDDAAHAAAADLRTATAPDIAATLRHLRPGEVALVPQDYPQPDARYFQFVQYFVAHSPAYPYRFIAALEPALRVLEERGLRPRFFLGPDAVHFDPATPLVIGPYSFRVRHVPWAVDVVELRRA